MSTFKYNKGKLVEQPTMEKPKCFTGNSSDRDCPDCKAYHDHIASLRTYIAEGFAEDELVEEKDFELIYQWNMGDRFIKSENWCDCSKDDYDIFDAQYRRIIARKVTKEEGEKPDCSHHKRDLFGESDMKKAAEAIGDLHYEVLAELIGRLGIKLYQDGLNDRYNGREGLGYALDDTSNHLRDAAHCINRAWKISKPFMNQNNLT